MAASHVIDKLGCSDSGLMLVVDSTRFDVMRLGVFDCKRLSIVAVV